MGNSPTGNKLDAAGLIRESSSPSRTEEPPTAKHYGNTCYCNSVLQALYHCTPFRNQLLALLEQQQGSKNKNKTNTNQNTKQTPTSPSKKDTKESGFTAWLMSSTLTGPSPASSPSSPRKQQSNTTTTTTTQEEEDDNPNKPSLIVALAILFREIGKSQYNSLGPKTFIRRLKEENDAHEFLIFLLNDIHENLQKLQKQQEALEHDKHAAGFGHQTDAANNEKKQEKDTFIQSIFGGVLTNELKCLCCENVTIKKESFLDLALDIEQNTSLTSCFKNFSSTETLSKQNKFYCDYCRSLQEAQKRMKIHKLPRVLVVQLKRFKYMENLGRFSKLSYRVSFPFELRIWNTSYDAEDAEREYYLFAVVVHIGSGPNHGHYVSLIKSSSTWLLFDDEKVSVVDELQIQNIFGSPYPETSAKISKCGYLLFYTSEPNTLFDPELDGINFPTTMGV